MNVRKEMEKVNVNTVKETPKYELVEFSYSSKFAFDRREAIKLATKIVRDAVAATGGDMPKALMEAYESWNSVADTIKDMELGVIKIGR